MTNEARPTSPNAISVLGEAYDFIVSIMNAIADPIFVKDREHRWVLLNDACCAFIGHGREELIGKSDYEFFPKEQADVFWEKDELVFTSREININEESFTDGNGVTHIISTKKVPYVTKDGQELIVGVIRDITEFKALQQGLERQAHIDYLTDLLNRRRFLDLAQLELARSVRYGNALSVLMLDLDHFKGINDIHGHQIGDTVLQKIAEVCRTTIREIDLVGRWGGEEFVLLLPETDGARAFEVAERLRQSVAAAGVPLAAGTMLHFTTSIGVASVNAEDATLNGLLHEADQALYEAKHAGRDRVCLAPVRVAPDANGGSLKTG